MQTALLVILLLALLGTLALVFLMYRKMQEAQQPKEGEQKPVVMLQTQLHDLSKVVDQKMSETHKTVYASQQDLNKTIQEQFGRSTKVIQKLQRS